MLAGEKPQSSLKPERAVSCALGTNLVEPNTLVFLLVITWHLTKVLTKVLVGHRHCSSSPSMHGLKLRFWPRLHLAYLVQKPEMMVAQQMSLWIELAAKVKLLPWAR